MYRNYLWTQVDKKIEKIALFNEYSAQMKGAAWLKFYRGRKQMLTQHSPGG